MSRACLVVDSLDANGISSLWCIPAGLQDYTYRALNRCPSLFKFQPSAAQALEEFMGKLPDIVLWAEWDRCLPQDGIGGGHFVIQFVSFLCLVYGFIGC